MEEKHKIQRIYDDIVSKLNYELKYANERVALVNELIGNLDKNNWICELLSYEEIINRVHKKKDSPLAEDQLLDKLFDQISEYLNHPKFKDKDDEELYQRMIKEKKAIESKGLRKRTIEDQVRLNELYQKIQKYHRNLIIRNKNTNKRVESYGDIAAREEVGDFIHTEEGLSRAKKIIRKYKRDDLPSDYWDVMFPKYMYDNLPKKFLSYNKIVDGKKLRKEIYEQFKKEIEYLKNLLGYNIKDKEARKKYVNQLLKIWEDQGINAKKKYAVTKAMYNNLVSDFHEATKILVHEVDFGGAGNHGTGYGISSDTWYTDGEGNIRDVSKNWIRLNDLNTYRGLILYYKDLKDKYKDNQQSDIWALIFVFEELIKSADFTPEEKFVLDAVFDAVPQQEIIREFEVNGFKSITKYRLSNLINNIIPNKLLNTYLNQVEEWLYTDKLKGIYKKCSKCGEVKLLNERYFRKQKDCKDGFRPECRICEQSAKKPK